MDLIWLIIFIVSCKIWAGNWVSIFIRS